MTPCGYGSNTAQLAHEPFAKMSMWSLRLSGSCT